MKKEREKFDVNATKEKYKKQYKSHYKNKYAFKKTPPVPNFRTGLHKARTAARGRA